MEIILIMGTIVVAIFGGFIPLMGMIAEKNPLGYELERYILNRNPKDVADVERLQIEYARKKLV